jgi:hypothetical protein
MDMEKKKKKKLVEIYWLEGLPLLLGILVPNILEPNWFWRILFVFWGTIGLTSLCVRGLVNPRLLFQPGVDVSKKPKILKIFVYCVGILAVTIIFIGAFIPTSIDIIGLITKRDWLKTSVIEIQDTHYYGAGPFFIGRLVDVVINGEQKTYYLIFYLRPLSPGTYKIIHSPKTYFIWDIAEKFD